MANISKMVQIANDETIAYFKDVMKERHISPSDISKKLGEDPKQVKEWMSSSLPYVVFLQLCVLLKLNATAVFSEVHTRMKTKSKTKSIEEEKRTESTQQVDTETSADDYDSNEDEEPDFDTPEPEVEPQPAAAADKPIDSIVNMKSPEDLPFDLIDDSEDVDLDGAGMSSADTAIMSWKSIVDAVAVIKNIDKAKLQSIFPKPIKTNASSIRLDFPNRVKAQGFLNKGFLDALKTAVSDKNIEVTFDVESSEQ